MSIAKQIARKVVLPISFKLGADKYFLKKSSKSCCIVNFHGVRDSDNEVFNNRHLKKDDFEKTIKYLSNRYKIVSLTEIFEIFRSGKKPDRKTIALTFDDGYKNNFEIALPILKKYNAPATFYLISKGLVNENFLVWPDIVDLVKKTASNDISVNGVTFRFPTFVNEESKMELLNYLKTCGAETEKLVLDLYSRFPQVKQKVLSHPELLMVINGEELRKYINEPLIEYGSHSHTHFNMEFLNDDVAKNELAQSKEIIEKIIDKKVISFAYPDGSYTKEINKAAKELGYLNLVAVEYKFSENNSDPNVLSRFTISNSTTFESNALRLAKTFDKYGF